MILAHLDNDAGARRSMMFDLLLFWPSIALGHQKVRV